MLTSFSGKAYDVIVLGSGISGTLAAVILAKKGYRVLIIDGASHPKFAVGESTTPNTSQMFELLGKRYGIPEISVLAHGPEAIRKHITTSCGVKQAFVFLYHDEGKPLDLAKSNVFGNVWRDENHLFRQDIDAHLFRTALRYGAEALEEHRVKTLDIGESGVEVVTDRGVKVSGRFLIDGCGPRGPLVDSLRLREGAEPLKSDSRSIFTHFVDIPEFKECLEPGEGPQWLPGTYHHLFNGGWFWVIPFNNWKGATNPAISVGLTLDNRVHPRREGVTPEEEFRSHVARFPTVAKHFANAKPIRPWVSVPKCQYSSRQVVGDRWCLMAHSAGFVDALYSSGLVMTVSTVQQLIEPLCRALDSDRFSRDAFLCVEEDMQRRLRFTDMLVFGSYTSLRDFELWNAWVRIWGIWLVVLESNLGSHLLMGEYSKVRPNRDPIASVHEPEGYKPFIEAAFRVIEDVAEGRRTTADGVEALWRIIGEYDFEIRLRPEPAFAGTEWAMKSRRSRDLFLGTPANHVRWQQRKTDPWLG
jgi:FADH2 O2-dependent halogenase